MQPGDERDTLDAACTEIDYKIINTLAETESDLRAQLGALVDAIRLEERPYLTAAADAAMAAAAVDFRPAAAFADAVLDLGFQWWVNGLATAVVAGARRFTTLH
ncbi:MAG TPA: hypothetical protein VJY39_01885 [Acidisphaera sp.]|nr:hypothetical protein [Acidisphaera sp.]